MADDTENATLHDDDPRVGRLEEQLQRERLDRDVREVFRELKRRDMAPAEALELARTARDRFEYDEDGTPIVRTRHGGTVRGGAAINVLATELRLAQRAPTEAETMARFIAQKRAEFGGI